MYCTVCNAILFLIVENLTWLDTTILQSCEGSGLSCFYYVCTFAIIFTTSKNKIKFKWLECFVVFLSISRISQGLHHSLFLEYFVCEYRHVHAFRNVANYTLLQWPRRVITICNSVSNSNDFQLCWKWISKYWEFSINLQLWLFSTITIISIINYTRSLYMYM